MELVRLEEPEKMNLLGLLLQGYLKHALTQSWAERFVHSMSGDIWMRAGPLWATLRFDREGILIIRGRTARRRASIEGDMAALLAAVTGQAMVRPFVTGKIRIGGNPLFLARMLPILAAGRLAS